MSERLPRRDQLHRLLEQHRAALFGYVLACVRRHHDAEDILQEVAVKVAEAFEKLTDEAGFLPWAREIARRCMLAHGRKWRREAPLDPELLQRLAEAAERLERARPTSTQQELLHACLDGLPTDSRRLILSRYDGSAASAEELARREGGSVQSVYARLKRIKAALRECVERRLAAEALP
jgi:RNA polymerase sigma-70 factor, ECF subfamily